MWTYLVGIWLLGMGLIVVAFHRELLALWREPVLRHPVLIIESDDWGAGPLDQAQALQRLSEVLARFRDAAGNPPVMTLGLVLAVPDGAAIRTSGQYKCRTLADPQFTPVLAAIRKGVECGVFALQLHGLEHYWPATLMASRNPAVQDWLRSDAVQTTQMLPSHLQSRWIDASTLPSRPLPVEAIRTAAREEIAMFQQIFGRHPKVAVPPTFVWDDAVEAAWSHGGVEYVVTPGVRNDCLDANGKPSRAGRPIHNAEEGRGVTYLVRDDYFEPMLGHTSETALAALARKTRSGRPCLLETHHANFIGEGNLANRSLDELTHLLEVALQTHPNLRFTSTEILGRALQAKNPAWVNQRPGCRLAIFTRRLAEIPRLGKIARLSGLSLLLHLAATLLGYHRLGKESPAA